MTNSVAMSTPSVQIIISKYHFPLKQPGLFGSRTGSVKYMLGNLVLLKSKEAIEDHQGGVKRTQDSI